MINDLELYYEMRIMEFEKNLKEFPYLNHQEIVEMYQDEFEDIFKKYNK